jgi:hypothetical protein
MKTLHACLLAGVALGLPLSVSAQSVDARYCSALANKYARFLAAPSFIRVTHGHAKGG